MLDNPKSTKPDFDILVVEAGFAGMYALHKFRTLGFSVRVIEAGSDVGGTWYWNRYPGARCDVESMSYSYSFDDDLQQEWNWTRRYSEQPEILDYANHVANRFDLRRDIVFDTRVNSALFDEDTGLWRLGLDNGKDLTARFCIMATGSLSTPKLPEVQGTEKFKGECYHTATWPHEPASFSGKRVALIGTGATGVQATPIIARDATQLTVFQRTANFSIPAWNRELSEEERADWKANYDHWRHRERSTHSGFHNEGGHPSITKLTDAEAQEVLEQSWRRGGQSLQDKWQDGPASYLGLCTSGFPNMFSITGPGSPSVLTHVIMAIEQHVNWIADCLVHMKENDLDLIEPSEDAEAEWTAHVQEVAAGTFYSGAPSWYMGANIPGKPKVFMPYTGGAHKYRARCDEVAAEGYDGFSLSRHVERRHA